jgi:serine/threonine protein kinase
VDGLLAQLARAPELLQDRRVPIPGTRVGRFEVLRKIGAGGFGNVYEARDAVLGRVVALKFLRPERRGDVDALLSGAETLARLHHPSFVTVFDVGAFDGLPYVVLERLYGETLHGRMSHGPLPAAEALRLATEVTRALAHAHAHGIVHRDVKPANVFLCDDGRVKVLDFGLSHLVGASPGLGGTRGYMAPELLRGERVGPRADVFALGVLFHAPLSNGLPYPTEASLLDASPPPRLVAPGVPRHVVAAVARALSKDPLARPPAAADLLRELAGPAGAPRRAPRRRRRPPRPGVASAARLLAAAVVDALIAR